MVRVRIVEARQREREQEGRALLALLKECRAPAAYRPQPVCESVNVAAAVASSGVVVVVVVVIVVVIVIGPRERERATAVEAGRPAGRRLISVAGGLADVCVLS